MSNEETELEGFSGEDLTGIGASSTEPFFVNRQAAAVLKHELLRQYLPPFTSKTGSTAAGGRVVFIDGYAGRGVYADGTKGSPALVLDAARTVAGFRTLECLFVERKKANFGPLRELVDAAKDDGIACEAFRGNLSAHLDSLLAIANGLPAFVFLDPFGLGLPFGDVTGKVLGDSRSAAGPPTEVLINFSANAIYRIGGLLEKGPGTKNREKSLESLDGACGGDWWREEFKKHATTEARLEAIADEYGARLSKATGAATWTLPVRDREHLLPAYYLVFATRHVDGVWLFNDCLAKAQKEWRRHLSPPPAPAPDALFELADRFPAEEAERELEWSSEIKANIVRIQSDEGAFSARRRIEDLLGPTLGLAGDPLIRRAVKELYREGKTTCDGKGKPADYRFSGNPA